MEKSVTEKPIATIIGMGAYVPENRLTNSDLEKMVDTSNEWIMTRSGIQERRVAGKDEFTSTMGVKAALSALKAAKVQPSEIDAIIVTTMTPDYLCPSSAAIIQHAIKAENACALDIQAACSGFLYGLSIAKGWIEANMFKNILVIASEKNSAFVDFEDRTTCILFGDGAGAALVSRGGSGYAIKHICLGADGEQSSLIMIQAGGCRHPFSSVQHSEKKHYLQMVGKEVFKHAVRRMESAARECLEKTQIPEEEISWLIPHQANIRIMEAIAKRFNIPWEKVYRTIHKYGNTSSSTVPIALYELDQEHNIKKNENILTVAFGGGLTWGASLFTKV